MYDSETQRQFVELRIRGVSKRTLIEWGRKFQFEIHNARVVEREALRERYLATTEEWVRRLGEQLHRVEAELAKRDVAELSTMRLFTAAESLRRQIHRATGGHAPSFTAPVNAIPADEYHEDVQDWVA